MEKKIGKLKAILEDLEGDGTYIQFGPDELEKSDFKIGDWVKWIVNDDGEISIEKASNEDVFSIL